MFIALYEFTVKPDKTAEFKAAWYETTQGIYAELGSLGSRLHSTTQDNLFIGYAQWPSRAFREAIDGGLSPKYEAARHRMKECLLASKTLHEMQVESDYLHSVPFGDVIGLKE